MWFGFEHDGSQWLLDNNLKISSGLFLGLGLLKSCLARFCEIKGLDNDHGSFLCGADLLLFH